MSILRFLGHVLTVSFGKTVNWRQRYKQTSSTYYDVSRKCVKKEKFLHGSNKEVFYKSVEVHSSVSAYGVAV